MNKYRNKKVVIDGIKFDSKKEANEYLWLKVLQKGGKILDLELQKKFVLQDKFVLNGKTYRAITYIADFYYHDDLGKPHVIDVKSPATKTAVYQIKKKMLAKKYGIEIEEV